ncbi:MAG: hypothetical protein U0324_33930 [Polyangiales bacterium]
MRRVDVFARGRRRAGGAVTRAGALRWLGALFVLGFTGCSLAPFTYRPLDAGADRGETSPPDTTVAPDADVGAPDVPVSPDAPGMDADVTAPDADVTTPDADVTAPDADAVVAMDAPDAPDVADAAADVPRDQDAGPVDGDAPWAVPSDACPTMPPCSTVATVSPPTGDGTAASPYRGWEALPAGACRVEFRPGVYEVNTTVILRSNLTIRCLSSGGSTVTFRRSRAPRGDAGAADFPMLGLYDPADTPERVRAGMAAPLRDVVIEGCTFDRENLVAPWADMRLEVGGPASVGERVNITVRNNRFVGLSDAASDAVIVLASSTVPGSSACFTVEGNQFQASPAVPFVSGRDPPNAIFLLGGNHLLVQHNTIDGLGGVVIKEGQFQTNQRVTDVRVLDNTMANMTGYGVLIPSWASPIGLTSADGGARVSNATECDRALIDLEPAFEDVHIERNNISVLSGTPRNMAGAITVGWMFGVMYPVGTNLCYGFRPVSGVHVIGNRQQNVQWGMNFGALFSEEALGGRISGRVAGAPVPYTIADLEVRDNVLDGFDPVAETFTQHGLLNVTRVQGAIITGNTFRRIGGGVTVSGSDITFTANTFEALSQRAQPLPWLTGSLNLVGLGHARADGSYGLSERIALADNHFVAPATSSATQLPALHLDRGVSGVTLTNTTFNGARYDCSIRVDSGDAGVPDAGAVISESGSTRTPSSMPARCP